MSNYWYNAAVSGNYVRATVTTMVGEDQFDLRVEMKGVHSGGLSLLRESNASFFFQMNGSDLKMSYNDGTGRSMTSSANVPYSAGDWFQGRVVLDITANPHTANFYTRDPDTDLADNSGWNLLGVQQENAVAAGTISAFSTTTWSIGGSSFGWDGGISQVLCLYDGDNKIFTDVDLRNLTAAELAADSFTADDSLTWTLAGDAWAYVRPVTTGLLGTAELLLEANDGNEGNSPKWADRSGNDHHAQLGSAGGIDTNDPQFLPYDGDQYVYFPGSTSDYVGTTPTSMNTEDQFDFRFEIKSALTGGPRLGSNNNGVIRTQFDNKKFEFFAFDGTGRLFTSSVDVPYSADVWFQVRAVFDGTSNPITVDFYTRDPGTDLAENSGWNTLGTQQTIADTFSGVQDSSSSFRLGGDSGGSTFTGGMKQALQMFGASNTIQVDVDFRNTTQLSEPFATMVADDSLTWTIARGGPGLYVVDQPSFGLHTDDYFQIPDDADLNFGTTDDFTMMIAYRASDATPDAPFPALWTKGVSIFNVSTMQGYAARYATVNNPQFYIGDGTNVDIAESGNAESDRVLSVVTGRRDQTGDDVIDVFADGIEIDSVADTITGTLSHTSDLYLGSHLGTTAYMDGEIIAVALWRFALTDAQIVEAGDLLVAAGAQQAILRPVADIAGLGWDTQPTPGQDLFAQVDEVTASDTDYIHTEDPNP